MPEGQEIINRVFIGGLARDVSQVLFFARHSMNHKITLLPSRFFFVDFLLKLVLDIAFFTLNCCVVGFFRVGCIAVYEFVIPCVSRK